MKNLAFVALVALFTVGCSKQEETQVSAPAELKSINPAAKVQKVEPPTGRWLVNQMHCDNKLDIRNVVDMNIVENGITKGNILIRGAWTHIDGKALKNIISDALKSDAHCLSVEVDKLTYTMLNTANREYVFASEKGTDVVLMVEKGIVEILTRFDKSKLSEYVLVDTLDVE